MKKMKKVVVLSLISAMMLSAFAGCGKKSDSGAIRIGGTGPLTGDASVYGLAAKRGAEIAVEEINALGGMQFELNYQDDTHDAEKAVNAYNVLKDWGVQISLGSVTSSPCVATAAETYADRIFALTPSASATDVTKGKDNMFQMCFSDPNQGSASAQYISDKKLGTKIAVIYKNDDVYSTGIYETFMDKAAELKIDVVYETSFNTDSQNDFSVQLGNAQDAGADLVFLPMYYQAAALILDQAKKMNYAPKFFGVDGMDGILTLEGFDTSLAEGVMLLTPFSADASDEKTVNFVKKYNEKFNETPNQFAADAYDCVYAIYEACQKGNVTPDMTAEEVCDIMIEQFTTLKFDGLTGAGMTWSANGEVTKSPKGMVIENGVYVGLD